MHGFSHDQCSTQVAILFVCTAFSPSCETACPCTWEQHTFVCCAIFCNYAGYFLPQHVLFAATYHASCLLQPLFHSRCSGRWSTLNNRLITKEISFGIANRLMTWIDVASTTFFEADFTLLCPDAPDFNFMEALRANFHLCCGHTFSIHILCWQGSASDCREPVQSYGPILNHCRAAAFILTKSIALSGDGHRLNYHHYFTNSTVAYCISTASLCLNRSSLPNKLFWQFAMLCGRPRVRIWKCFAPPSVGDEEEERRNEDSKSTATSPVLLIVGAGPAIFIVWSYILSLSYK